MTRAYCVIFRSDLTSNLKIRYVEHLAAEIQAAHYPRLHRLGIDLLYVHAAAGDNRARIYFRNRIGDDDVVNITVSTTADITAFYPVRAIREAGHNVPLAAASATATAASKHFSPSAR